MKEAEYLQGFQRFIFRDAVEYLKRKKALTKEQYYALDEDARSRAFTVAGYTAAEVIEVFLESVTEAVEQGKSIREFQDEIGGWLSRHGYEGVDRWRSETIFRTNAQTAYNVGHYRSMMEAAHERPYWMYVTAGDGNVRDTHAAMHGTVWAADDPVWDVWYPPNGFGCRCHVRSYTANQVRARGLTVQRRMPTMVDTGTGEIGLLSPDRGFTGNPAKQEYKPDVSKLAPAIRKAYRKRDRGDERL